MLKNLGAARNSDESFASTVSEQSVEDYSDDSGDNEDGVGNGNNVSSPILSIGIAPVHSKSSGNIVPKAGISTSTAVGRSVVVQGREFSSDVVIAGAS
jgi:hypothetical protein